MTEVAAKLLFWSGGPLNSTNPFPSDSQFPLPELGPRPPPLHTPD